MTDRGSTSLDPAAETFFGGRGELARLTRAFDWDTTPLGPVESWTASLRTTVSTLLASRHAMFLWWGPELIQFYNDGYRQSLGPDRHPSALGGRGRECWAEIWPIIGDEVESIMAGGESTWHEDSLVPITRGDRVHDVYWSYSYSPVRDDDGSVGGVLVTVQETTRRVVLERRARVLHELAAEMLQAGSVDSVCQGVIRSLGDAADDVAFALLYLEDASGTLRLSCATGLPAGAAAAPAVIAPDSDAVWPVARALAHAGEPGGVELSAPVEPVMAARWGEPVQEALTVAIATGAATRAEPAGPAAHGVLIIGFNPRLPVDESARQFAGKAAREVAATLDAVARVGREQDLLSGVFQLSPSFLAVLRGPEHVFELVNPAYDQLIGHRPVLGRRLRDVLPEVEEQGFLDLLDRVYTTGAPFIGNEVPVQLPPDGGGALESRYLNFVYQAMRGPAGAIAGVLVTGTDVTALVETRHAVEASLREAQRLAVERDIERRRLRTMLEQAPLAVALIGADGAIQFANATFERVWGRGVEDTSASGYSDAYAGFHLDGRPIASDEWPGSRAVQRGEVVEGEHPALDRAHRGDVARSAQVPTW